MSLTPEKLDEIEAADGTRHGVKSSTHHPGGGGCGECPMRSRREPGG